MTGRGELDLLGRRHRDITGVSLPRGLSYTTATRKHYHIAKQNAAGKSIGHRH